MSSEFLLPKMNKLLKELVQTGALRMEQWQRIDQALQFVLKEQSMRMMEGKVARRKPKVPSFVKPGHDQKKTAARTAVSRALQSGAMIKPTRCDRCRRHVNLPHLQGHHEDYSKPLEVIWLCKKCHRQIHAFAASVVTVARA